MNLPAWNSDQSATIQALVATVQGMLTIIALGIAIGVLWWQVRRTEIAAQKKSCG